MKRRVEEQVEDWAKASLKDANIKYYTKAEDINAEIDTALKNAPSKHGGTGGNFPDIKVFLKEYNLPVMIEVKGGEGDFVKLTDNGTIFNEMKGSMSPNYAHIAKYAINGAVHYATVIAKGTSSYKEVLAIGINGFDNAAGKRTIQIGVYVVAEKNGYVPKHIGDYSDLSFLMEKHIDKFIERIKDSALTEEDIERDARHYENKVEEILKKLNQDMQDTYKISEDSRVRLVAGMIMAALGCGDVPPLGIEELKGCDSKEYNDGTTFIDRINVFLSKKGIPIEKQKMILSELRQVFIHSTLYKPEGATKESRLKKVYIPVHDDLMRVYTSKKRLDFTGKLFNVLNTWVEIPDSGKNDVVLTPRYMTNLMARLCEVNKDSYVWDYAAGSAGFLISSMRLMIEDAKRTINSPEEQEKKIHKIKALQLLGVELRSDIYMLAVLNMILMDDGTANIIHKDSLKEYEGLYEQGDYKDKAFPATVFLLNPPYSAAGKGFVFVEKALGKMSSGKAAILIQENAGSGNGLPYTKNILVHNRLVASIHDADIFYGKAGVQTAIYVFEVGKPHNENDLVKFIDFSNDGYTRQNRKKASLNTNLRNTDNAEARYSEVVDIVLGRKKVTDYFRSGMECIEDTITLEGDDWTFKQHQKVDTIPTEEDFSRTVEEYLSWKAGAVMSGELVLDSASDMAWESTECDWKREPMEWNKYKLGQIFAIYSPKKRFDAIDVEFGGEYPYVVRSSKNNGIRGYITEDTEYLSPANTISFGQDTVTIFYQERAYFTGDKIKVMQPLNIELNAKTACYLITIMQKAFQTFAWGQSSFNNDVLANQEVSLPVTADDEIDYAFMEQYIYALEMHYIQKLEKEHINTMLHLSKITGIEVDALIQKEVDILLSRQ